MGSGWCEKINFSPDARYVQRRHMRHIVCAAARYIIIYTAHGIMLVWAPEQCEIVRRRCWRPPHWRKDDRENANSSHSDPRPTVSACNSLDNDIYVSTYSNCMCYILCEYTDTNCTNARPRYVYTLLRVCRRRNEKSSNSLRHARRIIRRSRRRPGRQMGRTPWTRYSIADGRDGAERLLQ